MVVEKGPILMDNIIQYLKDDMEPFDNTMTYNLKIRATMYTLIEYVLYL